MFTRASRYFLVSSKMGDRLVSMIFKLIECCKSVALQGVRER